MDSDHDEMKLLLIFLGQGYIRGQIVGSVDILFQIYHLGEIVRWVVLFDLFDLFFRP